MLSSKVVLDVDELRLEVHGVEDVPGDGLLLRCEEMNHDLDLLKGADVVVDDESDLAFLRLRKP